MRITNHLTRTHNTDAAVTDTEESSIKCVTFWGSPKFIKPCEYFQ